MKALLTVQQAHNRKWFVMNNNIAPHGKPIGQIGPYYKSMKQATIAMLRMSKQRYTNIYNISEKAYSELVSNR